LRKKLREFYEKHVEAVKYLAVNIDFKISIHRHADRVLYSQTISHLRTQ